MPEKQNSDELLDIVNDWLILGFETPQKLIERILKAGYHKRKPSREKIKKFLDQFNELSEVGGNGYIAKKMVEADIWE